MAGPFVNLPTTACVVILLTVSIMKTIDGTPYRSPGYYSYDDETQPPKTSNTPGFALPGAEGHKVPAKTATELKTIHYSESSGSYDNARGASRVFEITQEDRSAKFGDEKYSVHGSDDDKAAEDDDDDGDDEAADDNVNYNHNNNNNKDNTEDEIAHLIDAALEDDVFLSPKKWAAWLGTSSIEGTASTKGQKTRSPSTHSLVTRTRGQPTQNDRIVFPDEHTTRRVPTCDNSTFCLEPEGYLSDAEIENALKLKFLPPISEPSSISERMGPLEDDNGLCPSVTYTITPKTGISDDNEWYFILNNQKYVQSVQVEICPEALKEKPCKLIDGFSLGYKTTCKQKYVYRQLVAVGQSGGEPAIRPFRMESSCCCHVQLVNDPELRFGAGSTKSNQQSPTPTKNRN